LRETSHVVQQLVVVDEKIFTRFAELRRGQHAAVRREMDAALAAIGAGPVHEQGQNVVNSVAVHTLRCRLPNFVLACQDRVLEALGLPGAPRTHCFEILGDGPENGRKTGAFDDTVLKGFIHPVNAAVEVLTVFSCL
jgi:hypothetical protein